MANTKIIRNKISSITNTQKITKTMEMVAITKFKKAQVKLSISQPYLKTIKEIIFHFIDGSLQYKHYFFKKRKKIKNIGIVVISSNRGLCGSLNNNLFKQIMLLVRKQYLKKIKCHLYIIGSKGSLFFKNFKNDYTYEKIFLKDEIQHVDLLPFVEKLIKDYKKKNIDELLIISNQFHNTVSQTPNIFYILPIQKNNFTGQKYTIYNNWDYLYESNPENTIDFVLKQYILFQCFQLVLENIVSEQAARRIAMKIATDNSQNVIQNLKILYNKIRQFSITQELIEIVSGANTIT